MVGQQVRRMEKPMLGSRTLKRVPIDFDWPMSEIWVGYLNPHHSEKCESCDGSGYSTHGKLFSDQWYGIAQFDPISYGSEPLRLDHPCIRTLAERNVKSALGEIYRLVDHPSMIALEERNICSEVYRLWSYMSAQWCHQLSQADVDALVADNRLFNFTRVPRTEEQREVVRQKVALGENSWLPEDNGYTPTAAEVNAWSLGSFSHDSVNQWVCVRARCEREGVPYTCVACEGSGEYWPTRELKQMHDAWVEHEPPVGDGYQLWETCSEGSPISPVFATLEALCEYAAVHCSTFGGQKTSAARWREMLDAGHVYHQEGNMVFM